MIDKDNGEITFDNGFILSRKFTRDEIEKLKFGMKSTLIRNSAPWYVVQLDNIKISGLNFSIVLYFNNNKLIMVDMSISDTKYGTSWDDWTKEKEMDRNRDNKNWLYQYTNGQNEFPWGKIWAGYDEKVGGSSIHIRYK